MTYQEWQQYMARLGFTHTETTETGYNELRAIGFTPEDIFSIESDMQAGFDIEDAKRALRD